MPGLELGVAKGRRKGLPLVSWHLRASEKDSFIHSLTHSFIHSFNKYIWTADDVSAQFLVLGLQQ